MNTAVSLPQHQSFFLCARPYWDRGWWRAMTTAPQHLSSFGPDRHFFDIPPSPGRTRSYFPSSVPAARTPHHEVGMVPALSAEQAGRRHWRLKKHLMFHKAVGVRITLRSTLKPAVRETISALLFCLDTQGHGWGMDPDLEGYTCTWHGHEMTNKKRSQCRVTFELTECSPLRLNFQNHFRNGNKILFGKEGGFESLDWVRVPL